MTETKTKLDNRGVATIEYALVASLIALSLVAGFSRLGGGVEGKFNSVDASFREGIRVR